MRGCRTSILSARQVDEHTRDHIDESPLPIAVARVSFRLADIVIPSPPKLAGD